MEFCFKSFAEFEDYIYKKRLAYEELRDENIQLEMDRMKDSDRIAELEDEVFKLREKLRKGLVGEIKIPDVLKKSPAATDDE